ncbi:cyanophycinase [Deinococcus metalli]|uniref:Cyanophycinase n=1 Tax=Deinococcus metalli TaxID=1141878 RepID=A0A7W8NN09_9DEIO|nr:cyanophycinase [Deinococcus metalli]MBB5376384.1 cyanophycinase [Deinococcus metalli]GHF44453.1 cyanophycinase [Deinococcus metalli]
MSKHQRKKGTLIVIGGHEDKTDGKTILKEVARMVGDGRLVVTTVASHQPEGYFEEYQRTFQDLGVKDVVELAIAERAEARQESRLDLLDGARGIFFTGGDQLRITSQLGDTPIYSRVQQLYEEGGVVAGTSAGASVMSDVMLVSGESDESHRIGELQMAPGLGLIHGVVIDQHFAERGRMGRLLGAVAKNPRYVGIGIDENTAVVVEGGELLRVLGSGAVYVIDGATVTSSNIADAKQDCTLSIYDVRLHVLSQGDGFDLGRREPMDADQLGKDPVAQDGR